MRVFDRSGLLSGLFRARRADAAMCRRWGEAHAACPELAGDLIRAGGLLTLPAETADPVALARAQGRRDLAVILLSAMTIDPLELSEIVERNDAETD